MAITPRRRGRPTKDEEIRRALAEIGCDPTAIDPFRILASIAANGRMPPTARVAACRALIAARDPAKDETHADGMGFLSDAVSVRAQQLLDARRKAN
jgi:hypothetical protein